MKLIAILLAALLAAPAFATVQAVDGQEIARGGGGAGAGPGSGGSSGGPGSGGSGPGGNGK